MKIDENEMYEALMFLSGSDEELANLHAEVGRTEHRAKKIRDMLFLHGQGTVEARKAAAGDDPKYDAAMQEHFEAVRNHEKLDNERKTAELKVRVYQTLAANRRQGNV